MNSSTGLTETPSNTIQITSLENRGYIFNAEDYMKMRSEHRIVGRLVGTTPACPRNPSVNGLPAILSACELRLLLDHQLAHIQRATDLSQPPTSADAAVYQAAWQHSLADQSTHQRASRLNESRKQIERILAGKRQKLHAAGDTVAAEALSAEQVLADIGEKCVFQPNNALLQVPTAGWFAAFYPATVDATTASTEMLATIKQSSLEYRVFADLWRRGKWVTAGDTFGGTFLVYPGDPAVYHASHIVHCVPAPGRISAQQLVAGGRLSVLVNKLCVFAYEEEEEEKQEGGEKRLCYQTVEWEGKVADVAASMTTEMRINM